VPRFGCSTRLLVTIALVIAALFIVGLIGGAIGRALDIESPGFLHVPVLEITSFFRGDPIVGSGHFAISNTMIASWLTVIVVLAFAFVATRKMRMIPGRLQGLVEGAVETLLSFVESIAGKKDGRRFFPIVATIFIFVIFNAYLALVPIFGPGIHVTEQDLVQAASAGTVAEVQVTDEETVNKGDVIYVLDTGKEITAPAGGQIHLEAKQGDTVSVDAQVASIESKPPLFRSANTDINMTLALAVMAVLSIEFWGLRSKGRRHYLSEYANFGELTRGIKMLFKGKIAAAPMVIITGVINVFMGFIEVISHGTRIVSFAFRLFGNMSAGEILLLAATFLVPWIMATPFYGLELLIGFIQALIFAGLTLVWATMAVAQPEEEHHSD
jgi:F0F1-type ATP synthase membrane subunit a